MQLPAESVLKNVYGETKVSSERFMNLESQYRKNFKKQEMEFFSAPGRTEIVGNHTDHNGGKILAASVSMDTIGAAFPNDSEIIEIVSEGYKNKIIVDLQKLDEIPTKQGTLSLVAGMAKAVKEFHYHISGFHAYISSEVISSAGVSSSASFEMLICAIVNYFFNENKMTPADYAKIGQYAERNYWEKASGLMDQMACAVGGTILLDFKEDVSWRKVNFDFDQMNHQLVIVNTGKGHADLSSEYSEVPQEMWDVAKCLGCDRLADTDKKQFFDHISEIQEKLKNDRAILRALHFFNENQRVDDIVKAIDENNASRIKKIIFDSGKSSWELLQNTYSNADYKEQKVSTCLAITEEFLNQIHDGTCRIHGGGFAGVIMAVIPNEKITEYVEFISKFVGRDNVHLLNIRQTGAVHLEK